MRGAAGRHCLRQQVGNAANFPVGYDLGLGLEFLHDDLKYRLKLGTYAGVAGVPDDGKSTRLRFFIETVFSPFVSRFLTPSLFET